MTVEPLPHDSHPTDPDRSLIEQVRMLRSAFDGMSDAMIVVDRHGRTVLRNAAAERLGFDPMADESTTRGLSSRALWADRVTPYARDQLPLVRALAGETIEGEQLYLAMSDGGHIWLNVNASPLRDDRGAVAGAIAVYRDSTTGHVAAEALRDSEARYRRLVETVDVVPWEMDIAGERMTYVGPQIVGLLGYPAARWRDDAFWRERLDPRDSARVLERLEHARASNEPTDIEYRLLAADGTPVWVRELSNVVDRDDGRPLLRGVLFSIVARKKAEEALHNSQRLLQSIIDTSPAVIYLKDAEGRYLTLNESCQDLLGVTREQVVGKTDYEVFAPELAENYRENDMRVIHTRQPLQIEETMPHADGPRHYLSIKHPIFQDGKLYAVCGISTDITDRRHAEEKVRLEQKFLAETLKAHERDRQLLAYEIHDGLVQDIAAGVMHLESVRRALKQVGNDHVENLNASLMLFRRAIDEARRVLSGLRPPILDEAGVVLAIQYLVAEQQVPGTFEIAFSSNVTFDRLDSLLEGTIFRIVQEALTNIKRHSRSEEAAVRLTQQGDRLRLLVQDWGVGFDPNLVGDDHFGLHGIRKRAALAGGSADIVSVLGEGTRVVVELPIVKPVE